MEGAEISFDGADGPMKIVNHGHIGDFGEADSYLEKRSEDEEQNSFDCVDDEETSPQSDIFSNLEDDPIDYSEETSKKFDSEKKSGKSRFIVGEGLKFFKYLYSCALLVFCVIMVMGCLFKEQSVAAEDPYNIHPAGAFIIFWFLIFWLAMMEGGQGCIVGLQLVDKALYQETHKITYKNTKLVHNGDNLERFLVGRQVLVVLVVFLINMCGSAVKDADPIGLPSVVNAVFLDNGLAMMITTIIIGQLTSQVSAAVSMLDFINNYFMTFTSYVSLGIEFSGLLHCVYLVQIFFSKITGKSVESNEPPRNGAQNLFFWARVLMSTAILSFSLAVTIQALFDGNSGIWDGIPSVVSIIIFFLLLGVVGLMEGMQIAAFALINVPEKDLKQYSVAYANCTLMFSGQNLQSFLIGRQIFVGSLLFIVARIATLDIPDGEDNIFGVSDGLQNFFNTGLLGAVILAMLGSLAWRIIASSFPLEFMSNPLIYVIIRICLILEATGIASAAWLLALIYKRVTKYQIDEVYLGKSDVGKKDDIELQNEESTSV